MDMYNRNYNTNHNHNANYGGVGFFGLLTLLFIALKLTGVIAWSWLWILAPLWIPLSIIFIIFLLIGIYIIVKS